MNKVLDGQPGPLPHMVLAKTDVLFTMSVVGIQSERSELVLRVCQNGNIYAALKRKD